jgi:cytochrome c oxidase subunit 2
MEQVETGSALDVFGSQSSLGPAGFGAEAIFGLTYAMTLGFGIVFVLMMLLIWYVWKSNRGARAWWVWAGGIVLPLVSITVLMGFSTYTLQSITEREDDAFVIEVTGKQFWWDIVYDPDGIAMRDANEIVLPRGVPVTLRLKSDNVIHSFWIPSIAGKMDMIPGRVNEMTLTATETGRFRGQCAEFCGLSHPDMAFEAVVVEPDAFERWVIETKDEAEDAARPMLRRGREVFLKAGCAACHAIRGVAEGARLGPDLTRVGGRGALGAGMWRMNQGNIAGWIADVGDMKPGAQMPSYNHLSGPDLRAVSAYLMSLE